MQPSLGEASLNDIAARLSAKISHVLFLDLWPIANTSLYELRSGERPCDPRDAAFFERYRAVERPTVTVKGQSLLRVPFAAGK